MTLASLTFRYATFAVLSTLANLAAQALAMGLYQGAAAVVVSMAVGTAVGLIVKYRLDATFIFRFRARSLAHDGQVFSLYAFMGVFTTAIFWGVEYGFHLAFEQHGMRYLGGALGLAMGYWLKYQLDRRFVFPAIS